MALVVGAEEYAECVIEERFKELGSVREDARWMGRLAYADTASDVDAEMCWIVTSR